MRRCCCSLSILLLLLHILHLQFGSAGNKSSNEDLEGTCDLRLNPAVLKDYCSRYQPTPDLLLITVASNETDGFKRFMFSAKVFDIPVKVLGMGDVWRGGNVKQYAGGGYKINLFKEELEQYKDNQDKIIMFTDSYDVVLLSDVSTIVDKFEELGARVLFSAEGFCWPDESLASKYPLVSKGKRYLNSGGIIGYASDLYEIVSSAHIADTDDDQLFYTKVYLDESLRKKHNIKLDHQSEIFQNLHGAVGEVELKFKGPEAFLQNTLYNTVPLVVHGNGYSKLSLNSLGNYLAKSWNLNDGCISCWEQTIPIGNKEASEHPTVLLAIFVKQPTPFLEEFFDKIAKLVYPKDKIHMFIYNRASYHNELVENFIKEHEEEYRSIKRINAEDDVKESHARTLAVEHCLTKGCDYYFSVDGESHLDNPYTLSLLIEQNRTVIAPLLVRPFKAWSNFWGALTDDGFYARSFDYMDIIHNNRRGVWNVPYISSCYLVNATMISNPETRPSFVYEKLDPDMAFCANVRQKDIFMFVTNRVDFGHLVNTDNFDIKKFNPEMYQIIDNRFDWEQRYIHENYSKNFDEDNKPQQPCPDVYWFPIVTDRFCKELIGIMENYGKWSDGTNTDPRLDGGYENVPTRDIHMKQVDFESQWMEFLRLYVRPLQELVFLGYYHNDDRIEGGYEAVPTRDIHMKQVDMQKEWLYFLEEYVSPLQRSVFIGYSEPPRALMNFVVRYRPDEQPFLKPHHDSSTYTINIALNRANIDYQGGGCRFIRYNCSVKDTRMGWVLMHPGRLTHYHEGLYVTSGTRYIMISFVDP